MDFDDSTRRMEAYLEATPGAYLLGPRDLSGPFTLLDSAALENRRPDSLWAVPPEVIKGLESAGRIERFDVADKSQVGFRISVKSQARQPLT